MKRPRVGNGLLAASLAVVVCLAGAAEATAQRTSMSSTLRYGSGYFDVPAASVLPHMAIIGTYSGFYIDLERTILTDRFGQPIGYRRDATGALVDRKSWMSDASVAIGLFDRLEVGATIQSFGSSDEGGTMVGGFGQVALIRPRSQGLGLAVGARAITAPSFDGAQRDDFQPPRLGFPDVRVAETYSGRDDVNTIFTPYVVAGLQLPGFGVGFLPEWDFSMSGGWGLGMVRDGDDLDWYSFTDSNGWFLGGGLHFQVGDNSILHILTDWNGFDVNAGATLDLGGIRFGGFVLGSNYAEQVSEYRSAKVGALVSVAICPNDGLLCKPSLLQRDVDTVTVQLPAPPPDTVEVVREVAPPLPTGTPATMCLATGESVEVLVTAQGDTLVGPQRVSVRTLRPGVVFAGTYAEGSEWFENDEAIRFERRTYQKSGGEVRLDCGSIMGVGDHNGVPLFVDSAAERPFETLHVPVRPGVWQAYQTGLRRTRG